MEEQTKKGSEVKTILLPAFSFEVPILGSTYYIRSVFLFFSTVVLTWNEPL